MEIAVPRYTEDKSWVKQAMSASAEYFFGSRGRFEEVTEGEISLCVCLAPTSEGHGVRGFIATVIWPKETTAGSVEVQGADHNEDMAYHALGHITFPARQYSSPAGLVVNFMRLKVASLPAPTASLIGRLTIR